METLFKVTKRLNKISKANAMYGISIIFYENLRFKVLHVSKFVFQVSGDGLKLLWLAHWVATDELFGLQKANQIGKIKQV